MESYKLYIETYLWGNTGLSDWRHTPRHTPLPVSLALVGFREDLVDVWEDLRSVEEHVVGRAEAQAPAPHRHLLESAPCWQVHHGRGDGLEQGVEGCGEWLDGLPSNGDVG